MKTQSSFLKFVLLSITLLFVLAGCNSVTPEAPKDVIQEFKETIKEINAADFAVGVTMKGEEQKDNIDLTAEVAAKFDRREEEDRKGDFRVKLDGALNAAGKSLNGNLDLGLKSIGDNFYFNIEKLDSNDPSMAAYKQLIDGYKGKWLHLSSDFLPESVKNLQKKDEKTLEREKKLKDLFVNTNLFEVNKEFGIESLNGVKVYHYGVKLNENGVKDYVQKSAEIDGREMSDAEVEQSISFLSSIENIEMWIGVKDHYLYKGVMSMAGKNAQGEKKTNFTISFTGNSYNKDPKISAPEKPEEFNPITLMMQLQMMNPPAEEKTDTGEKSTEGTKKPEEQEKNTPETK